MSHADFEHYEESGAWGTGLLWPVARLVVIAALLAWAAHWVLNGSGGGALQPEAVGVASVSDPGPMPAPAAVDQDGGREIAVRADRSGHFFVDAVVNGADLRFLVDTGASALVISRADAEKLGIDLQNLVFSERYNTANGIALGAPVMVREFRIGSFSLHDVRATVMSHPMPVSLLGMSVLSRFSGHEVEGNKLVLRW